MWIKCLEKTIYQNTIILKTKVDKYIEKIITTKRIHTIH